MLTHILVKTIEKIKRTGLQSNREAKDRFIADTLQRQESCKEYRKNWVRLNL